MRYANLLIFCSVAVVRWEVDHSGKARSQPELPAGVAACSANAGSDDGDGGFPSITTACSFGARAGVTGCTDLLRSFCGKIGCRANRRVQEAKANSALGGWRACHPKRSTVVFQLRHQSVRHATIEASVLPIMPRLERTETTSRRRVRCGLCHALLRSGLGAAFARHTGRRNCARRRQGLRGAVRCDRVASRS
jgi:hypothetical protein